MHNLQESLLKLVAEHSLSGMTLRQIGELVGEQSPQKVKHHLQQLSKKGFITYDPEKKIVSRNPQTTPEGLVSIPIVGAANCGPAQIFADENINGYLRVSKRLAPKSGHLFALRADGNSMNRASINHKTIEEGDFVIVDADKRTPQPGDYVVSIIDQMANIKRFVPDPENDRVILRSESSRDLLPIFIHEDDDFLVCGEVVDVIKK